MNERIEGKWIDCFTRVFELCKLARGDEVAILSETQSRRVNVRLAELALLRLGTRPFHVVMPTPPLASAIPIRSTGSSVAVGRHRAAVAALASSALVADLTVEGMLHAPELPDILAQGSRLMMVSNEHPELLERLVPDAALAPRVQRGIGLMRAASRMHVTSKAGTDLDVDLQGARAGGVWGYADAPKAVQHWPGGLCACFPRAGTVNGTLVMEVGDVNLTFKRYLEARVILRVESDYVTAIEGGGLDAELMRGYFAAWNDRNAYASSHLGWGMNPAARWDALTMYDREQVQGTELRVFAGNFLFSTGANPFAGRYTLGHFDLPMRNCSIALDARTVVDEGRLVGELA
jgi:2,5-dihydroxypyridine 5,6-dioxygenase